jgi:hypothetical protein
MLELAKCLKLVAPITMSSDAQMVWIQAAVDALEDIRADEVRAVSAELRRTVTRPAQIVPEIAKLVHARRQRSQESAKPPSPYAVEIKIHHEACKMRAKAHGDRLKLNEAWEWERQARIDAGLHVPLRPAPLSRDELDGMSAHIRQMGLTAGFLEYHGEQLVEVG